MAENFHYGKLPLFHRFDYTLGQTMTTEYIVQFSQYSMERVYQVVQSYLLTSAVLQWTLITLIHVSR